MSRIILKEGLNEIFFAIAQSQYFDATKIFHHGLGHKKSSEIDERFYRKAAEARHVEAKSVLALNPDFHGIILADLAKKANN